MDLPTPRYGLKARYLFPVDRPPIADGLLVVDRGRIAAVGVAAPDCETIDLGNVALIPGLVNAHVHLEFSDLAQPLGNAGIRLPEWIRLVLDYRAGRAPDQASQTTVARNVQNGLAQSIRHGTTLLGEISSGDWPLTSADHPPIDTVVFREVICLRPQQVAEVVDYLDRHLRAAAASQAWQPAVSPHAPFTCRPEALQLAIETSRRHRIPLAMHLAESPEEIQWMKTGGGPLAELLENRQSETYTGPTTVRDILNQLTRAHRTLVIHGNYLNDEEIQTVAAVRDRMSLVYCPRTHSYFQHATYPLPRLLDAGLTVAVGTDGRGSNPDLSVLAELRHVAAEHPQLPLDQILKMGTLAGATALGVDHRCGSLTPGKHAHFAVVSLPEIDAEDPHELLLHSDTPVQTTIFHGS
ncbi:MAG: amidohydrolase family protein [Planctomycetota bacterium]|nr:amidohydrolase family protein [Planctomycetota bacterium]